MMCWSDVCMLDNGSQPLWDLTLHLTESQQAGDRGHYIHCPDSALRSSMGCRLNAQRLPQLNQRTEAFLTRLKTHGAQLRVVSAWLSPHFHALWLLCILGYTFWLSTTVLF
jgi:hypothetical protein